jgi:hypothetical protein
MAFESDAQLDHRPPTLRLFVGGTIFFVGFLAPLFVPLVTRSDLPAAWKTTVSGLLVLGVPELGMIIAVAILGKTGFNYLKTRLWKTVEPPEQVSSTRYRIGLVLFSLPLLLAWFTPYTEQWLPGYEDNRMLYGIVGDAMFIASLFVLGGEFWDKLRALFIHRARVVFEDH